MKFQNSVNGVLIATSFIVAVRPSLVCDFIDFNVQEFKLLGFENIILSTFSTKKYTNETEIGPFRPNSEYYMTFSPSGIISGQTVETYDLDTHSVIEMAYYFNSTLGMAADFLFIIISPSFTSHSQVHPHAKAGWRILRQIVNTTVTDARIKLMFGSSYRITFMVEYIKISNSNSNQPNCLIETSTGSTLSTTGLISTTAYSTTFEDSSINSTASTVSSIVTTLDHATERYMSNITIENSSTEEEPEEPTTIFERTTESKVTLEFTPEYSSASSSNEDSTTNTEYAPNYSTTISRIPLHSTPYERSTVSPHSPDLISTGSSSTTLSGSTVSDISKITSSLDSTTIPNEPNTADSSTITEIEETAESTKTTSSVTTTTTTTITTTDLNTTHSICSTQDCSIIILETTTPGRSTADSTTESIITNIYSTNSTIATEDMSTATLTTPADKFTIPSKTTADTSIIGTTNLTILDTTTSTATNDLTISPDPSDSTDKNEIIIYPLTPPASSTITIDFSTESFITNSTFSTGFTINDISTSDITPDYISSESTDTSSTIHLATPISTSTQDGSDSTETITKIIPDFTTSTVTITEPITISNSAFDHTIKSDSTTDEILTKSSEATDAHSTKPSDPKVNSTSMITTESTIISNSTASDTTSAVASNLITDGTSKISLDSTGFSIITMTDATFDFNTESTTPFHLTNSFSTTSTYLTLTGESSVASNYTTETDPNNSNFEFHTLPLSTNSDQITISEENDNTSFPPSPDIIKTTDLTDPPDLEVTTIIPEQIIAENSVNEMWVFVAILSIVLFCIVFTGGIYTCLSLHHTMKENVQQPVDEIRIDVMSEEQSRGLTSLPRLVVSRTSNDEVWIHNANLSQCGTTNSVNSFLRLKDKRI